MSLTETTSAASWSNDWRITLGITLGVLVFCGACAWFDKGADHAWLTIQIVTSVAIGGGTLKEWLGK